MANDLLIEAISRAGLTNDQVADACGVDPKTVSRWIAGRIPHPRYRVILARELTSAEDELWPDTTRARGRAGAEEIVGAWARRSDSDVPDWRALMRGAQTQVDLLGYSLLSVIEQRGALKALATTAGRGVPVRICLANPEADFVLAAGMAQRGNSRLPARIRTASERLQTIQATPGLELRRHNVATVHTLLRCDDDTLASFHLHGVAGFDAPTLHLHRRRDYGIFDGLAGHFESVWALSHPLLPEAEDGREAPERQQTVSGADALLDRLEQTWRPS